MILQGIWGRAGHTVTCHAVPNSAQQSPRQRRLAAKRQQKAQQQSTSSTQLPKPKEQPPPAAHPASPPPQQSSVRRQAAQSNSSKKVRMARSPSSSPDRSPEPEPFPPGWSVFVAPHLSQRLCELPSSHLAHLGLQWAEEVAVSMEQCAAKAIAAAGCGTSTTGMVSLCASIPKAWWSQLSEQHQQAAISNMTGLAEEALSRLQIGVPTSTPHPARSHAPGVIASAAALQQVEQQMQHIPMHALAAARSPGSTTLDTKPHDHLTQQQHVDITWAASHLACAGEAGLSCKLQALQAGLNVPFLVLPLCFPGLDLAWFEQECRLAQDMIYLDGGAKAVQEVRLTGWQSDAGSTFKYSGKEMQPEQGGLSPSIAQVRDVLWRLTGAWYDSVLINLYPDGRAGMRYHADPLYGTWTPETSVVSVGVPRRFAFRETTNPLIKWQYTVRNGDVAVMFGDCQDRLQHSVITSPDVSSKRISLVYKQLIQAPPVSAKL